MYVHRFFREKRGRKLGTILSQEIRDRMSEAFTGLTKNYSEEEMQRKRDSTSERFKGVPKSDEQKQKMSESRIGIKDSDITKERKSEARLAFLALVHKTQAEYNCTYSQACRIIKELQ